ncbi:MAG: hypothetical protein K2P09_02840 [Erysipelotrichales bacterium]|nr:hypothetical protein [Erysipelotrichales bacterium]
MKKDFDFFNELGLKDLDDVDKEAIDSMKADLSLKSFFEAKKGDGYAREYSAFAAMYTQNYLLLKQLLQINKGIQTQNEILQQQNNQIIELLQKIADK